ncbi:MAG: VTT domain-containing protein [Pirellulaceae bacterium]
MNESQHANGARKASQDLPIGTLVTLLLLILIPFFLFESSINLYVQNYIESNGDHRSFEMAAWIVGLLAIDVFLPVPSSVVATFSGVAIGLPAGTLVNWLGLNLAAAIGYWSANWSQKVLGRDGENRPVAASTAWAVAFCRGLPVVAEGTLLFAGLRHWRWQQLWFPIATANLLLAFGYAALGYWASTNQMVAESLAFALALPVLPLLVWAGWRRYLRRQ